MTQPYDRQRVPNADVLARQQSKLSEIWRRWLSALVELVNTKVGLPWKLDEATGSLYPSAQVGGETPGIGNLDASPAFVAVGDIGPLAIEGAMIARPGADGGGVTLIGYRNEDPGDTPNPDANAIAEMRGIAVLLTGQALVELPDSKTDSHYALLGPTMFHAGKHYAQLEVGPRYVPAQSDTAIDTRDLDVTDDSVLVASLTLTNNYPTPEDTTFFYGAMLHEAGGRTAIFTIDFYINDAPPSTPAYTVETQRSGNILYATENFTLENPRVAGDVITMWVSAVSTHPSTRAWVRGQTRQSKIEVRQG